MQIHIQRGEENLGSFSLEQTTQYFSEGRFQESDLAWHEGLSEWRPLGEVYTELTSRTAASQTLSPGGAALDRSATADEFPESFAQGRYLTQQLLGQGGMGQVWLVYDEQLERPVALKTLHQRSAADERALRELKEEVQKCLELTHPNIIRIYDLAEPEGEDAFISMEYVSGEDLSQKLKQHPEGRFEWKDIESYSLSLCGALEYAHDQGMVHRDLKPQNLMVSGENELKLADFGIAATATTDGEEEVPRAGTPLYWGPQQAQGMTPAPTDDIYSLGITLYHLLVGEAPFRGTSEPEITRQHVEDEPMHPQKKLEASGRKGKIPGYVSDLILKCLAKKPTERFQRASEVKAWIEAKGDPVAKKQKRMAMVAVASMALMLVMGALSVWAIIQKKEAVKQKGIAEEKRKEAETQLKKARVVSEFVGGIFKAVKPGELENVSDEDKDLMKLVLNKGAERIKDLEDQPEVEASIRSILGEAYYSLGFYDEAFEHHGRSLSIRLELFGPDDLDVADSYNGIGVIHDHRSEYDKALEYYHKALEIRLNKLGPSHPNVAVSYNNIGGVHGVKGDYKKALEYLQKTLAIELKAKGSNHIDVATSYNNIGVVYDDQGEYDKALEYYQKALAIDIKQMGADHPDVARSYNNIGLVYNNKFEHDKALEYLRKALVIWLKQLGPDHLDVATSYNNIAAGHDSKGEYDKALENNQKALEIRLNKLGPSHPDVATSYNNIGVAHDNKGEYDKALENYQKAHVIFMGKFGPNNSLTKRTRSAMDKLANTSTEAANEKAEFERIRILAEQGDVEAQLELGNLYREGNGVSKDFKKAVEWYRKSAGQGYDVAQNALGFRYFSGTGVPKDIPEALKWFLKAAEQGLPVAQANAAFNFEKGPPEVRDLVKAYQWNLIAIVNGYTKAETARDSLSKKLTADQITKAETLAQEIIKKNPKLIKAATPKLSAPPKK